MAVSRHPPPSNEQKNVHDGSKPRERGRESGFCLKSKFQVFTKQKHSIFKWKPVDMNPVCTMYTAEFVNTITIDYRM